MTNGTAWATNRTGLSLALGAFLAGVAVSEGEYGAQALADVLPLRDTFSSLFFISIGMLFDLGFVLQHPLLVSGAVAAVLALKGLTGVAAVVLQKSTREGFGLTVAEAMWKGKPVIGGTAGGITVQILSRMEIGASPELPDGAPGLQGVSPDGLGNLGSGDRRPCLRASSRS